MYTKKEAKLLNKIKHFLRRINCPRWLHHYGPKKYEFYQHVAALILKECFKLSFRRVSKLLNMLGIQVPTYSALCKMRKRIPLWMWKKLLESTVDFNSHLVAVDSTGLSRTNPKVIITLRELTERSQLRAILSSLLSLTQKERSF